MTTDTDYRPRRSALYVPANNARALAKAPALGADAIVFDLEDAVAPAARPAARAALVQAVAACDSTRMARVVRVNGIASDDFAADLAAVADCRPDAVLLPKVESAGDLHRFAAAASDNGLDDIGLWAMVETAGSLLALESIVTTGLQLAPRFECLVVGTNDIAKETGVDPGDERRYLVPWLMQVVLVARRHRVAVLDGVWNDFADTTGFEAEVRQSVRMAFDGKTLIHPSQVEPANRMFSPSPEAIAAARRIVTAFDSESNRDANVIQLDGRMVERLHFEQARRLLALQAAIEQRGAAGRTTAGRPAP
jgi:citrate lyase subunit beta/citryl-CoA lyase